MNLNADQIRFNQVKNHFCKQHNFQEESKGFLQKNIKVAIHVFNNDIKQAISEGSGLHIDETPDFSIVKNPDIVYETYDHIIKFTNKTQFSLWRILETVEMSPGDELFPFLPIRKEGKVMRTPSFQINKAVDYWELANPLLVR